LKVPGFGRETREPVQAIGDASAVLEHGERTERGAKELVGARAIPRPPRGLRADLEPARVVEGAWLQPCERRGGVRLRRVQVAFLQAQLREAQVGSRACPRVAPLLGVRPRGGEVAELECDLAQVAVGRRPPAGPPRLAGDCDELLLERDRLFEVAGEAGELAAGDERLRKAGRRERVAEGERAARPVAPVGELPVRDQERVEAANACVTAARTFA
jgi:hypothetical protein